jgi:hypothetical protein
LVPVVVVAVVVGCSLGRCKAPHPPPPLSMAAVVVVVVVA